MREKRSARQEAERRRLIPNINRMARRLKNPFGDSRVIGALTRAALRHFGGVEGFLNHWMDHFQKSTGRERSDAFHFVRHFMETSGARHSSPPLWSSEEMDHRFAAALAGNPADIEMLRNWLHWLPSWSGTCSGRQSALAHLALSNLATQIPTAGNQQTRDKD